ncbi:hypothetical protein Tco_0743050 [Tanacetum coccineum]
MARTKSDEEVSSEEDVDEWLNAEMSKRMTRQDKEEEEDSLIDILKQWLKSARAGVNVMPKSLFENLKLVDLKETSIVVEMANMTKKAPLGIIENILLENEYELKAGRKRYALDEVWGKCEKFHDTTKLWYEGFEEEVIWKNRIEEIDYTPPLVKSSRYKEVEFEVSSTRFHVIAKFCLGVTILVMA